jgi:GDP-4-dehydro-6-deoxy-D-mannose reductase
MSKLRVMVTGAGGFVGRHLIEGLKSRFLGAEIFATVRHSRPDSHEFESEQLDVTSAGDVHAMISDVRPSHLVHLAGLTTLAEAEASYTATWQLHLFGVLNVANAILAHASQCVFLSAGSGEVYGATARSGMPLNEGAILSPLNEYAVTKAAADLALGALTNRGLRSIRFRPFNHTGPGQSERFAIPSFAKQIVDIERGLREPIIKVGNLEAERDFLDVRDVVGAYLAGIAKSDNLPPDALFNVASGVPLRIRDILDKLLALSDKAISVERDVERMRANDVPRYVGDAALARGLLGWSPQYEISETLECILDWFRAEGVHTQNKS